MTIKLNSKQTFKTYLNVIFIYVKYNITTIDGVMQC